MCINSSLIEVKEGCARIYVPDLSRYVDPAHAPVFYNPNMILNRTLSTLCIEAYRRFTGKDSLSICEPLSGTGVRGIRYALEVSNVSKVVINDVDEKAYKLMLMNVELNNVKDVVKVFNDDASILMLKLARNEKFDIVDIDPFGSPIPFIRAAFKLIGNEGMLCVTATDLAVLMGTYMDKCLRRYHAKPLRITFSRELGLRILIGSIARIGLEQDIGIRPLMAYWEKHYYRLYLLVEKDVASAKETLQNLGYAIYRRDGERWLINSYPHIEIRLSNLKVSGPLWIGKLCDVDFMRSLKHVTKLRDQVLNGSLKKLLNLLFEEATATPLYYTSSEVFKGLGREYGRDVIIELLRELGYDSWRTHFDGKGFKTIARFRDIKKIVAKYFS